MKLWWSERKEWEDVEREEWWSERKGGVREGVGRGGVLPCTYKTYIAQHCISPTNSLGFMLYVEVRPGSFEYHVVKKSLWWYLVTTSPH